MNTDHIREVQAIAKTRRFIVIDSTVNGAALLSPGHPASAMKRSQPADHH